jgi:hypothetical protein
MMCDRRVVTWDQLTLGGSEVRFHSETTAHSSYEWECDAPTVCQYCYEYDRRNVHVG